MAKNIGPSFAAELRAAGLAGLPFTWGSDGSIDFDKAITPQQRAAIEAVYAAHDPAVPGPAPRDLAAEIDALAAKLAQADAKLARADAVEAAAVKHGVLTAQQIEAEVKPVEVIGEAETVRP